MMTEHNVGRLNGVDYPFANLRAFVINDDCMAVPPGYGHRNRFPSVVVLYAQRVF
jgi:hypothetical protein